MLVGARLKALAVLCALVAASALPAGAQDAAVAQANDPPPQDQDTPAVTPEVVVEQPPTDAPEETDAPETTAPSPTQTVAKPVVVTEPAPETPSPSPTPESKHDAEWYWKFGEDPRYSAEHGNFVNFLPNDDNQTCSHDTHATPFNRQVRGVNLGGWLVLEPWLTPTLFYQFLSTQERFGDKAPEKTAMDIYTFCTALGTEEANRQLRVHWANWVTEEDIADLAAAGINSLRVPVGDWMFNPYVPFIGCTDGAVEELDRVADLAYQYGIDILIDMHGLIGSQNGFDNSGKTTAVHWTSIASTQPVGTTTFEHWPIRQAEWAGTFNTTTHNYTSINYDNLNHSVTAVEVIINRYAKHPAILGLQPVNEPWELTPIQVLKDYYWKSYKRVKAVAPHWKFVLHDSFRFGLEFWADFMRGCPDIALDTHIYQAWMNPGTQADFFSNACQQKYTISDMENALMPVIVGEWSLGTDNCAMWLNGFNDNLPGFPKVICHLTDCPVDSTYLGKGFPGTPLDLTKPIQGPYGTGISGPSFGKCPVTSQSAFGQEDDLEFTRNLNLKKLNAFALGHGWYFWNFKTEFATKWDFLALVRQGAFPKNVSFYEEADEVFSACVQEDKGDFVCAAKRGVKRPELENGLAYACNADGVDCTDIKKRFLTLEEQCDWAFNEYWHVNREKGATCDFGGAAHLLNTPFDKPSIPQARVGKDVPQPTKKSTVQKAGHAIVTAAKWGLGAIIGVSLLALIAVGLSIFGIYRWYRARQLRDQYSPIAGGR
jgi:glucan 1,3-beta-glucosidase